jgi:diguanylate cyclase (GGDEF)-like protein
MQLTPLTGRFVVPTRYAPASVIALVIATMLAVFALDRITGAAPVQHLYYVPVILAGFRFQMRGGVLAGLSAIVLYHLANPHLLTIRYRESDLLQIVLFLAVGVVAARLSRDANRLHLLAMTDDLTGLHNLRSFEGHLATMVRAAREGRTPVTLLSLDVDHLKALNDQYGHATGAEAVRTVGQLIAERLPPEATACRYGGDEFVIAVPHGGLSAGLQLADDLCSAVRSSAPVLAGRAFAAGTLSISVGVASGEFSSRGEHDDLARRDREDGEALFGEADAALYRAKANGRNQAVAEPSPVRHAWRL